MHRDKPGIYLNDHLAGATFGIGLAQRIAHQHRHSMRSTDVQRISDEIAQDRQTLLELMDALGVLLGVEGKTLIWRTLLVVATGEPRLMNPSCKICCTGRGTRSTRWRRCASRQRRRSSPPA